MWFKIFSFFKARKTRSAPFPSASAVSLKIFHSLHFITGPVAAACRCHSNKNESLLGLHGSFGGNSAGSGYIGKSVSILPLCPADNIRK